MGQNVMDEIDNGNFFDQIDDLIEFPPDSECGIGGNFVDSSNSMDFRSMWSDPIPESELLFPGDVPSDLSTELSVPYEDIVQLEWLSTFVEDSFSGGGLTIGKDSLGLKNNETPQKQFETSSPVSVLESSTSSSTSSSYSAEKTMRLSPNPHRGPQKARSKRARPTSFSTRPAILLVENPHPNTFQPESENFAESASGPARPKQKKKKIRTGPPVDVDEGQVRKCMHCEITKTPQWRAGPMGPKTLCNACGVRYKSGRLFPEYRPAASPTFVPALHSNSHKKVLEMRCVGGPMPEDIPRASRPGIFRSP